MLKDVYFVHIAKCAGTSVVDTFKIQKYPTGFCKGGRAYFLHKTPLDVRSFGLADWNWLQRSFKFTFIREPYERAASHYHWCKKHNKWNVGPRTTFLDYCNTSMRQFKHHGPQVRYFEGISYDFVGRFENIDEDMKKLAELLGEPETVASHLNKSNRPMSLSATYCEESKRIVEEFYREDFERFGYEIKETL